MEKIEKLQFFPRVPSSAYQTWKSSSINDRRSAWKIVSSRAPQPVPLIAAPFETKKLVKPKKKKIKLEIK